MGELMLGEREREGRDNGRRADAVRLGFGMGRCYMRMDVYEMRNMSNKVGSMVGLGKTLGMNMRIKQG